MYIWLVYYGWQIYYNRREIIKSRKKAYLLTRNEFNTIYTDVVVHSHIVGIMPHSGIRPVKTNLHDRNKRANRIVKTQHQIQIFRIFKKTCSKIEFLAYVIAIIIPLTYGEARQLYRKAESVR